MSKRLGCVAATLAVLVSQAGCYTTKIVTTRPPEGRSYEDRQWFTIGGLVPLSSPAGRECQHGLSSAESRLSGTDWLINVGLAVAGGVIGSAACGNDTTNTYESSAAKVSCATAFSALVPFMLGSRTVEYSCAAPERPEYMPPPAQNYAPPQAPPPAQNAAPPPPPPPTP